MTRFARLFPLTATLVVAALAVVPDAAAQAATSRASASSSPTPEHAVTAGPTRASASLAVRPATDAARTSFALQRRASAGRPVALMIVGGAAIVVGSIIGDAPGTLFMIGGAVALLYGLYLWLQ